MSDKISLSPESQVVQILWLAAIVVVPSWLMLIRRGDWLLIWIVVVTCTDVGAVRSVVNIAATSAAGLLLLPYSARILVASVGSAPSQWALAHLAYLVLLGLAFGLAFPWPDDLGRSINLRSEGRTVLYLLREIASLSIAVFVGQQIAKTGRPDRVLRAVLVVAFVSSLAAVLEYASGYSPYLLLTEGVLAPTYWNARVRGLNFEPRGLGLVLAHAITIGLVLLAMRIRGRTTLAVTAGNVAALALSASTSGLISTAAGVGALTLASARVRRGLRWVVAAGAVGGALIMMFPSSVMTTWQALMIERIGSTVRFGAARGWFEQIAYRLEIFDAASVLFLVAHPIYAFLGAGPGLVSIPATPYLPITAYTRDYAATGINSPPTMGVILEIANGGFLALLLWAGFVIAGYRALDSMAAPGKADRSVWLVAKWSFVAAAAIYLVAAGFLSSCWAIFMGLALGASFARQRSLPMNGLGDAT